ncbi:MAG: ADP-ribosylation factor-like protein [Promethearchaeota archaeon]
MSEEGESLIRILVLSYFDVHVGPKLFLHLPEANSQLPLDHLPLLMDFYDKGFFIHEFGELKSSNLIFTIPSPGLRGDITRLMISIITPDEEDINPKIFQGLLEQFIHDLKEIKDAYKGFYREEEEEEEEVEEEFFKESHQIYTEIKKLLDSVYDSFPKETISVKARPINLAMFDFFRDGKSQIAKVLGKFISTGQFYKLKSEEANLIYSKIIVSEYSISKPLEFNKFLKLQLKNQDGLIFVVDTTNSILFKMAELTLDLIFKSEELMFLPSLILIDKKDTDRTEIHNLTENLRINEDEDKSIKFIPIDAPDDDKIREAFNWIIKRISIKRAQIAF